MTRNNKNSNNDNNSNREEELAPSRGEQWLRNDHQNGASGTSTGRVSSPTGVLPYHDHASIVGVVLRRQQDRAGGRHCARFSPLASSLPRSTTRVGRMQQHLSSAAEDERRFQFIVDTLEEVEKLLDGIDPDKTGIFSQRDDLSDDLMLDTTKNSKWHGQ